MSPVVRSATFRDARDHLARDSCGEYSDPLPGCLSNDRCG